MTITRRALAAAALAPLAAAALPPRLAQGAQGQLDLSVIDPELRASAARIASMSVQWGKLSDEVLDGRRASDQAMAQPRLEQIPVQERTVSGAAGAPPVTVYVINARPGAARGAILHTHGGGYVLGQARNELRFLQELARDLDCVVVSVEYRLAPQTRFEGSLEDNYAALSWLHRSADELGARPDRIALLGESAGGGHAALLAIAARDRKRAPVAFQALIYPMLDDRTGSLVTPPDHVGKVLWDVEANRYGWRSFLGAEPGGPGVPAAGVPARTAKLEGLPPTFIAVGGIDLFVDEDIAYARRLIQAGVPTELHVYPGAYHAFDRIAPETAIARRFTADKMGALRRALA